MEVPPLGYRASLAGVALGFFHLHPVTPLSLKFEGSNFLQNYFWLRSIFCNKKNQGQIDNYVTMRYRVRSRVSKMRFCVHSR